MVSLTGLGELLRNARKAKGYSLDDLQEKTKIQKRYLAGIEEEDFSNMPGAFYIRAFIKQYAEAVGVDPDEALTLYKEASHDEKTTEQEQQAPAQMQSSTSNFEMSSDMKAMMPKFAFAAIFLIILGVIWFVYSRSTAPADEVAKTDDPVTTVVDETEIAEGDDIVVEERPAEEGQVVDDQAKKAEAEKEKQEAAKKAEAEKEKQEAAKKAEAEKEKQEAAKKAEAEKEKQEAAKKAEAEKKKQEDAKKAEAEKKKEEAKKEPKGEPLKHVAVTGETTTYRMTAPDQFIVTIETSEDSWIGVTDENYSEIRPGGAAVMTPGESVEIDASNKSLVRIRVGNIPGTKITVNGQPVEYANDRITQNILIERGK